jgi:hypothetical protein
MISGKSHFSETDQHAKLRADDSGALTHFGNRCRVDEANSFPAAREIFLLRLEILTDGVRNSEFSDSCY